MKAVIMAGGKGTRVAKVARDIPKPMIRICGKPILQHQIECLKKNGIDDITIVTGYLGNLIKDYFGSGSSFGVKISWFHETQPLGTAGSLYKIFNCESESDFSEDFILLCGDTIFDIDFRRFINFHYQTGALASLLSHPNSHPFDSALIVTEILQPERVGGLPKETHRVVKWLNKEDNRESVESDILKREYYKNRVNAGIEIINSRLLKIAEKNIHGEKVDLDRDILKPCVSSGKIFAYDTSEYIKDAGTPERLLQVENDINSGLVENRNLSKKQKAVFLDRDGTLNKKHGFICSPDQLELLEGTSEAIKKINSSGYLAIVVTNQPQIARGELTFGELYEINNKLETLLGKEGAYIDAIYFCPHHTDKGFEGERIEYKVECECRKPKPGMLLKAAKDFNIDLSKSIMIGDSENDILAGKAAGCKKNILLSEKLTLLSCVAAGDFFD